MPSIKILILRSNKCEVGIFLFQMVKENMNVISGTQMTPLMAACYHGNIKEVQKGLDKEIPEREVYNSLVMCREGREHNPANENYCKIIDMIRTKYPDEINPDSGKYAESVLLDYRGPRARYSMYEGGKPKGLIQ